MTQFGKVFCACATNDEPPDVYPFLDGGFECAYAAIMVDLVPGLGDRT